MDKLSIQDMRRICSEEGLRNYDRFIEWFRKRFPHERCQHYFTEWIERFKSGDPVAYMDLESKRFYEEVFLRSR